MSRMTKKTIGTLATAMLIAAVPAGAAQGYQDLRSPDTRDAAAASQARSYQDLRSPDARDAALPKPTSTTTVSQPGGGSSGIDWDTVALIGGSVLSLALLGFGGRMLAVRHARKVPAV
jgi:hypothetical protein